MRRFGTFFTAVVAAVAALVMLVHDADARAGRGGSFGSRGANTFSAPPSTRTAPNTASPMQRTMTQPGQPGSAATAARPATQPGGGFFSGRGLLGGLAAGLIGMLTGSGFLGGMAGFASFLGLLLQIGLVVLVVVLVWRWFQRRNEPATASGPSLRDMTANRSGLGALGGLGGGVGSGL